MKLYIKIGIFFTMIFGAIIFYVFNEKNKQPNEYQAIMDEYQEIMDEKQLDKEIAVAFICFRMEMLKYH